MDRTALQSELRRFAQKLKVPAVVGGVVSSDGQFEFEVVGERARGSGIAARRDDQWHIGSCSKSFTAVLYARLVELGITDWQRTVASLFPDLEGQISSEWDSPTVEELFLCIAGMQANPSRDSMQAWYSESRSLPEQRTSCAVQAMEVGPNTRGKFVYSNLSYVVIGAAIDRLTGMSYEDALQHYVLKPLGIESVGYGPPPAIHGHAAMLRLGSLMLFPGKSCPLEITGGDNPAVFSSAGTLHLSVNDWAKFLSLFISRGGDLISPESLDYLLSLPADSGLRMAKGWAKVEGLKGVSYAMQGSNTFWVATAMMDEEMTRMSVVVCNDGRSRLINASALFAAKLLSDN